VKFADTCPHCGEILEGESLQLLANRMWVHEATHPQGCPDLQTIIHRIKTVRPTPAEEGALL
jgi:hypothetical protein